MKLHVGTSATIAISACFGAAPSAATSDSGGCFDSSSPFHPDDWMHCQEITDTLRMYYTPLNDTIMMGLHATEDVFGWSALAPSGNGGMKGAAQIVVRQDNSGEWIAEDRHSFDKVTPSMDEQQDVQLLFAQQDEDTGETAWGVVIPQDPCDEPYDYAIENRDIMMLWAVGSAHDFGFHKSRGQFMANLMDLPPVIPDLNEYDHIDLVMPNVHMVRGEPELDPKNPFICTYFDLAVLGADKGFTADDKIQMVGYEPIIKEGNEEYIHHLTLFSCEGTVDSEGQSSGFDGTNLEHNLVIPACTSMPPGCNGLFVAWAIGQDPPIYPEDVGFPIGEGQRFLVMQMHYFNPNLDKDVYDSSGLKLHFTTDPRPIDAGLMSFLSAVATGQQPPLPGGMKDVTTDTMYVEPDCTQAWTEPLSVLSVFHHSHFMGLKQEIVVERDGKNMGPMRTEYRYDYNHQVRLFSSNLGLYSTHKTLSLNNPSINIIYLKGTLEPNNGNYLVLYCIIGNFYAWYSHCALSFTSALAKLLPGDRMSAVCHFDTSGVSSDSVVEIGEESDREMCFQAVFYYPKQQAATGFTYGDAQGYSPWVMSDYNWCSMPPTEEVYGSLCAEKFFQDIPGFYQTFFTNALGYDGPSFDFTTMCNGGDVTADIRALLQGCPQDGCTETQSCSNELLIAWAQGACDFNCGRLGLTQYPDVSDTTPFDSVTYGCPSGFDRPDKLAEPEACQVKGSLPQTIELVGAPSSSPDDGSSDDETLSKTESDNSGVKTFNSLNALAVILMLGLLNV
ncbi:hypothetical protein ACHAXR_006524 [Thalassiosira sp. AJA248-18]